MFICRRCGSKVDFNYDEPCFYCEDCKSDNDMINKLTNMGHTKHCACRIVFGDGECECDGNNTNTKKEKRDRINKLFGIIKND